jgi:ELM2 domain
VRAAFAAAAAAAVAEGEWESEPWPLQSFELFSSDVTARVPLAELRAHANVLDRIPKGRALRQVCPPALVCVPLRSLAVFTPRATSAVAARACRRQCRCYCRSTTDPAAITAAAAIAAAAHTTPSLRRQHDYLLRLTWYTRQQRLTPLDAAQQSAARCGTSVIGVGERYQADVPTLLSASERAAAPPSVSGRRRKPACVWGGAGAMAEAELREFLAQARRAEQLREGMVSGCMGR